MNPTPNRKVSDATRVSLPLALIIDDDASMRELIQFSLEGAGFKVVTAKNGSEGMDRLKAIGNVSVIILDVQMPIMNGNEVLDEMRLTGLLDKVPVLILSAKSHVNEYNEVCKIMTKPVDMDYLVESVKASIKNFIPSSS